MDETAGQAQLAQASRPGTGPQGWKWRLLGPLIAIAGAAMGLLGSAWQELQAGGLLVVWVGAPVIEEALKPSGLYLLLGKWPGVLHSRAYTVFLSALSGLVFGAIENVLYLYVFIPDPSPEVVQWRWTVATALHTLASFVVGFGINRKLVQAAKGEIPIFGFDKRFFLAAMALHSAYNIAVTIWPPVE